MDRTIKIATALTSWEYVISTLGYSFSKEDIDATIVKANELGYSTSIEGFIESCREFIKLYDTLSEFNPSTSISKNFSKINLICKKCINLVDSTQPINTQINDLVESQTEDDLFLSDNFFLD